MKQQKTVAAAVIVAGTLALLPGISPAQSAQSGPIITAVPQPDGSIVHMVGPGESCVGIAVAYNISLDELYSQNSLTNDKCGSIFVGQTLVIRPPQHPTLVSMPTTDESGMGQNPSEIVAPPVQVNGSICVNGFEDKNGNGIREPEESELSGMTFVVNNGSQVIATYTTDTQNASYCFAELPPGFYFVLWRGEGLSPTTDRSLSFTLEPGATEVLHFGAKTGYRERRVAVRGSVPSWFVEIPHKISKFVDQWLCCLLLPLLSLGGGTIIIIVKR